MFGGTRPTSLPAFGQTSVEIVTGVNLPMVIKLATQDNDASIDLARLVRDEGQQQIRLAGDILAPQKR
jgi:PTS system mannose-specific IIA component